MKILIDECLPAAIKGHIAEFGYDCITVREAGLGGKKNGELLAVADGQWDVLLTNDKNIKYQQIVDGKKISILIIRAKSNRLDDLLPAIPGCISALRNIGHGLIVEVGAFQA